MKKPDEYIEKYGTVLSFLRYGNTINIKGILQPLYYKRKSFYNSERTPSGVFDPRHYQFITTSADLNNFYRDLRLSGGGQRYIVKSFEPYIFKGEVLYVRAVLTACTDS